MKKYLIEAVFNSIIYKYINTMKKYLLVLILYSVSLFATDFLTLIAAAPKSEFSIIERTSDLIKVEVKIPEEELLNIEPVLTTGQGLTELFNEFSETQTPYIYQGRLIAVDETNLPEIIITEIDSIVISLNQPFTIPQLEPKAQSQEPNLVYLGKPGKLGTLCVVPIAVKQFALKSDTDKSDEIVCYHKVKFEIRNVLSKISPSQHSSWSEIYKSMLLNYQDNNSGLPGKYLIITPDALYTPELLQFAQWKELKGYSVTIKTLSEIGTSYTAIRNYISQFYNAHPDLEYVLLVGSASLLPSIPIPGTSSIGDHLYSCVAGNDIYPDVFIGRLPASNTSELAVMIAKILGYEKNPWTQDASLNPDTLWFRRALMVGTQYSATAVVWTALATLRWTRDNFLQHNYLRVDTIFDPPYSSGIGIIDTIITKGVTFVNGRGWGNRYGWDRPTFRNDHIPLCNNGWKLPIITSFYCATGNFAFDPCFGKLWLSLGTPTQPKGAVAFYGPTYGTTSTRFNNCQNYGVYWGIFNQGITHCGPAMFRGKLEMLANFPLPCDSVDLKIHVLTYNLLGDPSLQMWIGRKPESLYCDYSQQIPVGASQFSVLVRNQQGQPVENALVSLYKRNEVKAVLRTNINGIANFNIITTTTDTLFVTASAQNYIPYQGICQVTSSPVYIGYYSHSGALIAGQTINLTVSLKNYGTSQSANNIVAILRTQDSNIQMIDSIKTYGNLGAGQIGINTFQFTIAPNCTNGHRVNFQLMISSSAGNNQAGFSANVRASELSYARHQILDGNNQILEPGETANLLIKIYNRGLENINNVSGILRFANPSAIRILDSTGYFGNIPAGDSGQNNQDLFSIQASSQIPIGRQFNLQLVLRAGNDYERMINIPIIVGVVNTSAVLGPDAYGYYAYENIDIGYSETPVYQWIEIDPNYGGQGTKIQLRNDAIKTISLPFNFKFYGRNYNRISVCSNGYLAMDSSAIVDPYNWHLPSPLGAPAMIAPFWDDFHPDTSGASGVYYYYDVSNHRFIVQWSRVRHIHGFKTPEIGELQTFQVLLLDPIYYPTITGDGVIVFQYNEVYNDDSTYDDNHNYATVGIENYEQTIATQLTFANQYPLAVGAIVSGRAVKFTTNPPDTFTGISEGIRQNWPEQLTIEITPNPLRDLMYLSYHLPFSGIVNIRVYDITGKLIKVLSEGEENFGQHKKQVDFRKVKSQTTKNKNSAGVYFVRLTLSNNQCIISKCLKIVVN
ncbi:MAG: C25 family cysteine peptidase [candidate division WOR-3 bacterium]